MWSRRIAGGTGQPDTLPLVHTLPTPHSDLAQVGINGLPAVPMINHDHIAIANRRPASENDDPAVCSPYSRPHPRSDVDRQVTGPIIIARDVMV